MFSITRKKIAVVSTVAVLGLGGGIAYAYFTGTGTGTGVGRRRQRHHTDIHVIGTETARAWLPGWTDRTGHVHGVEQRVKRTRS